MTPKAIPCPSCRRIGHSRPSDATKTGHTAPLPCGRCHLKAIAPLGDQAAADKHRWRAIPGSLEQIVAEALKEIPGITWGYEHEVGHQNGPTWWVDFLVVVPGRRIALEVQAESVHEQRIVRKVKIRTAQLRHCFDELIFLKEGQIRCPDFASQLPRLLNLEGAQYAAAACAR